MSQAGSLNVTSTPSVPTTFTSDDGSATPVANILIVSADDTTENDVDGLRTVAGGQGDPATASNEVRVELTNRLQGTGSTVGAVTSDLITFDLGATDASYRFEFRVAGRDTATGDSVGYSLFASFKTDGATATIVDNQFKDADEDTSLETGDMNVVASGNNVIVRATGVVDQTITYSAVGYYVVV